MRQEACATARESLQVETDRPRDPDATVREGEMEGVLHVVGERRLPRRLGAGGARVQRRAPQAVLRPLRQPRGLLRAGLRGLDRAARGQPAGSGGGGARLAGERPGGADPALPVRRRATGDRPLALRRGAGRRRRRAGQARRGGRSGSAGLLDSVRAEIESDQGPPQATGVFVVGGIEACLCDVLAAGEPSRIWDALPELMHLAVGSYLGKEAADEAFEAAKELLERDRAGLEGGAR